MTCFYSLLDVVLTFLTYFLSVLWPSKTAMLKVLLSSDYDGVFFYHISVLVVID